MKKGFTLTELLVAIGLLAGVLTASTMIFHYSIESQRTAMATAEIMRTLRAITDQLNSNLSGLKNDGYLIIYSDQPNIGKGDVNHSDALYFFSDGDFQSSKYEDLRSNVARIYFGPAKNSPNDLLLDIKMLTPDTSHSDADPNADFKKISFVQCQTVDVNSVFEDIEDKVSNSRPVFDANNPYNLLAQRVTNLTIDWAYSKEKWPTGTKEIQWYPDDPIRGETFEQSVGNAYKAKWTPRNQNLWPQAIRFKFTLYDSKGIIKRGKTFEHIVYIGK